MHLTPPAPHSTFSTTNKLAGHHSASSPYNLSSLEDAECEDWDTFRHFVKIIQIVGELIMKYEGLNDVLDKKIQITLITTSTTKNLNLTNSITKKESSSLQLSPQASETLLEKQNFELLSIENYKQYLLEDVDRMKLMSLISIVESGK